MALQNKLGITDSAELAREEERISKKKAVELYDKGLLDGLEAGKFSALRFIHKYLFDDIYVFVVGKFFVIYIIFLKKNISYSIISIISLLLLFVISKIQ